MHRKDGRHQLRIQREPGLNVSFELCLFWLCYVKIKRPGMLNTGINACWGGGGLPGRAVVAEIKWLSFQQQWWLPGDQSRNHFLLANLNYGVTYSSAWPQVSG